MTTEQAQIYGASIHDRIVKDIAITDLDINTTGNQGFDPWKSYDVKVRTNNPVGYSGATFPPYSIQLPYHDLQADSVTVTGATLSISN